MFSRKPQQNVHIVTGLLQNHRACLVAVAPVPAYKAVRLMPVRYVFNCLNGYNVADRPRIDKTFQFSVKRRVAQNMAHHDMPFISFRRLFNFTALRKIGETGFSSNR